MSKSWNSNRYHPNACSKRWFGEEGTNNDEMDVWSVTKGWQVWCILDIQSVADVVMRERFRSEFNSLVFLVSVECFNNFVQELEFSDQLNTRKQSCHHTHT